jgi:hypothetical protein
VHLDEVDAAIDGAKDRWDHAGAPYDPDVLALIRAAEQMRAYIGSIHGDHTDPMPVFVLKAKDRLAFGIVMAYADACEENGLDVQQRQVLRAAREFAGWRERNPGLMKTPDHRHVPVGDALAHVGE